MRRSSNAPRSIAGLSLERDTGRAPWQRKPSWVVQLSKGIGVFGFTLCIAVPVWMVVATSLATPQAVGDAGGMVLWPGRQWSLNAYRTVWDISAIPHAVLVSLFVTVLGTLASTTVTTLAAYGLSRPGTLAHRPILFIILGSYLFGPGMIPLYLMVRTVGLYNSLGAMFVPGLFWAFNLVVLRNFFMALPAEIIQSARIDGASEWRILRSIVLPLSRAPIAVIALFYGVSFWNNFFSGLLYEDDSAKFPIQLVLRDYLLAGHPITQSGANVTHFAPQTSVQMAVMLVAMVPVMVIYPFVQKHFVQGVVTGAVKG